ncbi:hypothetical protein evm_000228 [Chilo suppressalis]|nr:hypothetical protein evm_000228 [Chilo suppressalis]
MDIRNFFEKGTTREKRKKGRDSSSGESDENDNHDKTHVMPRSLHAILDKRHILQQNLLATQLSTEKNRELLQHPWIPPRNYDFESDASHLKRKFNNA